MSQVCSSTALRLAETQKPSSLGLLEVYEALRERVLQNEVAQAELAHAVACMRVGPLTIDLVWQRLGPKPLFAATNISTFRRHEAAWEAGLYPSMDNFLTSKWDMQTQGGGKWRKDDAFTFDRATVGDLQTGLNKRGAPTPAVYRLFAIRSVAYWLNTGGLTQLQGLKFEDAKHASELSRQLQPLRQALGLGWGVATICHGIMDLGFPVVKPDLHVVRTLGYFNAFDDVSTNRQAVKASRSFLARPLGPARAVVAARELASQVTPLLMSQGYTHREVDIVLLHASLDNVLASFKDY
jgi:hypothetical protein